MPDHDHSPGAAHMLPGITCTDPQHCPTIPEGATAGAEPARCENCRELQALFDMQQRRMAEATARWRAEDPTNRANVLPDLGALLAWLMAEIDRARAALEIGETELVPTEALAAIPEEHRRTMARFLAAQSTLLRPSWLFPAQTTLLARDSLRGAAVTLVDPLSEDSTVQHAAEVLSELFFPAQAAQQEQQ